MNLCHSVELIARIVVVTVGPTFIGAECVFYAEPAAWTAGSVFLAVGSLIFLRKTSCHALTTEVKQ